MRDTHKWRSFLFRDFMLSEMTVHAGISRRLGLGEAEAVGSKSAVNTDGLAGDVRGCRHAQERHHRCRLLWISYALHRSPRDHLPSKFLVTQALRTGE